MLKLTRLKDVKLCCTFNAVWLLAVSVACSAAPGDPSSKTEPEYKGRELSEWVLSIFPASAGSFASDQARAKQVDEAIKAIGSNAAPFLAQWIGYERPAEKNHFLSTPEAKKLSISELRVLLRPDQLAEASAQAFVLLGPEAAPAAPQLGEIAQRGDQHASKRALSALRQLGQAGVPIFSQLTRSTNVFVAATACAELRDLSRGVADITSAVPDILVWRSKHRDSSALPAELRSKYLADAWFPREEFFGNGALYEALARAVTNSNQVVRREAVRTFGELNEMGYIDPAIIRPALSDKNLAVRTAAATSLEQIK